MLNKLLVLVGCALLLSGCSSAPPSGSFANDNYSIPGFAGTVTLTFTPASGGIDQVPMTERQCALDPVTSLDPTGVLPIKPCVAASSQMVLSANLPSPAGASYNVYLVGGSAGERSVGDLADGGPGTYILDQTFPEDLTGQHSQLEIRLKGYVVATAPATPGDQTFQLAPISGIKVDAPFEGGQLSLTISGLQENGTYKGRLYTKDPASGAVAPAEFFDVKNGATIYSAKEGKAIADYAELHIHVGDSSLNLYKASIKIAE